MTLPTFSPARRPQSDVRAARSGELARCTARFCEPNKQPPAIIVGSPQFFGSGLPFRILVPLTGEAALAIAGASILIPPTPQNGCTKRGYALSRNVQSVAHARLTETPSRITDDELASIRAHITGCIGT